MLISGSIFIELKKGVNLDTPYYWNEKKYFDVKPYIMGCSFGPYYSKEYIEFYKRCFNNAKQVSL